MVYKCGSGHKSSRRKETSFGKWCWVCWYKFGKCVPPYLVRENLK